MKNSKGITLITLVITIIVLLMLVSVTIAMMTGKNGLLTKATRAKEQTEITENDEKLKLAVLAARDEEGKFSQGLLREGLKKYGFTPINGENETIIVTVNEKNYKINSEGKIEEALVKKEITAAEVVAAPSEYYGKTVTNYTSANGQSDWKIFYSNGTNIFLITSDYLDNSKIDTTATEMTVDETYVALWNSAPNMQTVSSETLRLFKATGYSLDNNNDNSKCISTLLNTNNWERFKDKENKAKSAIGSPTVEMWMESWNQLYPNDKVYCDNTNSNGYYVGTSSSPTSTYIYLGEKEGYGNKLFYPHTLPISDRFFGIWLASPSATNDGNVFRLTCYGDMSFMHYRTSGLGVRPVVCLNSGITIDIIN